MKPSYKFGKRSSYQESGSTYKIIETVFGFILLIAFVVLLIAFLRSLSMDFAPIGSLPLIVGMLGDPFRTTRRMTVPFKSRVGHRERAFLKFGKICIGVSIGLLFLYFLASIMEMLMRGA